MKIGRILSAQLRFFAKRQKGCPVTLRHACMALGHYCIGQSSVEINNWVQNGKQTVKNKSIDLMHNDVTRLDAREECWFW
jgi:hypothetical protein